MTSKKQVVGLAEVFFDLSNQFLMVVDAEGVILDANKSFAEFIGLDKSKVVGKKLSDYLSEEAAQVFFDYLELAVSTGKARKARFHIENGAGEVADSWRINIAEGHSDVAFVSSEKGVAGEEISESSEDNSLISVIESVPQFNVILDNGGTILYQNKSFNQMKREDTVGTPMYNYIHEDFHLDFKKSLADTFKSSSVSSLEIRSERSDGVLAWYSVQMSPTKIEKDKVKAVNVNIVDVTDKKNTESKLNKSETLYRTLVSNMPQSVMLMFDREKRYQLVEGTGIEERGLNKEMVGKTPNEALTKSMATRHNEYYDAALSGESLEYEIDEGNNHYKIIVRPIVEGEEIVGGLLFSMNITSLKVAQEELEARASQLAKSNEDLEQFAYVASHDLQEPLRMIGNFVQLLEKRYKDKVDARGQTYIQFTVDGVNRMSKLIQDLLVYSRVGRLEGAIDDFYVEKLIESSMRDLKPIIKEREIAIEMGDLPLTMRAIKPQLEIVFKNLIENAIKFNDKTNPSVKISGKENSNNYEFTIRDNGIGIDKSFQSKVFTIFQKFHAKEEYPGSGIGLALVKKIVTRHGGEVWFDTYMNKGTTMHFTISKTMM